MVLTSAGGRFRLDKRRVLLSGHVSPAGTPVHGFGVVRSFCEFKRAMNKFMNEEFIQGVPVTSKMTYFIKSLSSKVPEAVRAPR